MGVMPVKKLLISMSLPMMISMFVQAMYNIVDSIFVAKISENALTAVSLAFPMQTIMFSVAAGTGVGVNALVSRALGAKDFNRANKIAVNGLFIYFVSYIVMLLLGIFAVRPFFAMQTNAEQKEIMELGVTYLTICMVMCFGIYGQFIFERLLQSTGRTFLTMITQGIGAIINIIFDPIFIFVFKMGIAGAAWATVLGQIVAACLAFIFNHLKNTDVRLILKGFRPSGEIIGTIYKIAVPSIFMQAIGSVMTAGMNLILMGLSSTAAAVFGVYYKLQSFFFMPVIGLNNGMIPIISYNYGARKKERMLDTLKFSYVIAAAFCLLGFLAFELIPGPLLKLFSASDEMISIGTHALRIVGLIFLAMWYCVITGSFFQALGKAMYSLYVSAARQLVVLLPAAYILAKIGGLSLIWLSFPIAEVMSLLITLVCRKRVFTEIVDQI
ncbi:MAG: MATE family efflux transporter [Lachnospiraceae bacterium]|nr:MATE family efflux transporter [Lachnospiraceae bacterium]